MLYFRYQILFPAVAYMALLLHSNKGASSGIERFFKVDYYYYILYSSYSNIYYC